MSAKQIDVDVTLEAHELAIRAGIIDYLVDMLNELEGALDLARQHQFSAAVTVLVREAPELKQRAAALAEALSGSGLEEDPTDRPIGGE
jgi:hypothetical protein